MLHLVDVLLQAQTTLLQLYHRWLMGAVQIMVCAFNPFLPSKYSKALPNKVLDVEGALI